MTTERVIDRRPAGDGGEVGQVRDERSMRIVELAMAITAIATAVLLAAGQP